MKLVLNSKVPAIFGLFCNIIVLVTTAELTWSTFKYKDSPRPTTKFGGTSCGSTYLGIAVTTGVFRAT